MRKICLSLLAVAAASAACAEGADAGAGLVAEKAANPWHFRIGPVMSPRVRVKMHASAPATPLPFVTGQTGAGTGAGTVPAAPSAGYVARQYADGYVKPDEGTEDPDSIIAGLTWDWGADDVPAQYSNGRMEFHTDMTRWTETAASTAYSGGQDREKDRDILLGVEAMGGWTFFANDTFDAAVDAGFRFYGSGDLDIESRQGTQVTTTRNEYRVVDSYDASGWTDVPAGPHIGTPGGPGRILGATPTRREELMGSTDTTQHYYYDTTTDLDYRIWDLRLGPTAGWKATERLTLRGGVYGLLGLVDAKMKTDIHTQNGAYSKYQSKCEAVFGLAFGASAQFNLTENLFLMGGAEYDWWSDAVSIEAGGADARIKLSDFTVSLALGVEF